MEAVRPALRLAVVALLLAAPLLTPLPLAGCRGDPGAASVTSTDGLPGWPPAPATRPHLRSGGPRLPPVSGVDPTTRGWVRVGGLLWAPADEAVVLAAGGPPPGATGDAFVLRTDHVSVRSDASWPESVSIARAAEGHVLALFAVYAEALDLRLPGDPLPVVLHRTRATFDASLRGAAPGHPGWGAFYEAGTGTVHVCLEPAPAGALPLLADLRHEMTHQVLDLSTPSASRSGIPRGNHLWLWEGFAGAAETLGDTPGTDTGEARRARFLSRLARGQVDPLATLFRLDQAGFEGRHYDHAAVFVTDLLADRLPGGRSAALGTLAALLAGRAGPGEFERRLGAPAPAIDAAWRRLRGPEGG